MNLNWFERLARARMNECLKLCCGKKNLEYSRGGDKLHNFKRAGDMLGVTPEKALVGMFAKHLVSILDMVDDLPVLPDKEIMEEKITDSINYLLLLEALIKERYGTDSK